MRYRVKTYTAFIPPEQDMITIAFPIPDKVAALLESHKTLPYGTLDAAGQKMMTDALRVIADETQGGYILAATGAKNNIRDVYWYYNNTPTTLQFNFVFSTLIQHAITQDDLAAIAALATTDQFTIEMDFGDLPPEYLESTDDAHNLAAFFNITEATEYQALTPAEAIAIARDCQYNVMGTDWPIPTWLPTGVTEAQVESAAEGLGIPYHEPTQTA